MARTGSILLVPVFNRKEDTYEDERSNDIKTECSQERNNNVSEN